MTGRAIDIQTSDGICDATMYYPPGEGRWPAILFYMDGLGIRDELRAMAERLASNGYCVFLPNLYYRAGAFAPFDAAKVFQMGPEQDRVLAMTRSIDNAGIMRDTATFLKALAGDARVAGSKVGCVGYCMGGQFALTAAGAFPDSVAAAASIHGGSLATDRPDSPHLLAGKIRAKVYLGVAEIDPWFLHEEKDRLEAAFDAAGVDYTLEVYPKARHGFAVNGMPVYSREASERHWHRLLELFRETLA
jgi:carboxymethylenebutenolidase